MTPQKTAMNAEEKAREIIDWWCNDRSLCQRDLIPIIAKALTEARNDAFEEAAKSIVNWNREYSLENHIRALKSQGDTK